MPPSTRNVVITLTIIGLGMLIVPAIWMWHIASTTITVNATVIDQKRRVTSSAETCHPTIEYTVEGKRYVHYFTVSKDCADVGESMSVAVRSERPREPFAEQSTKNVPVGLMVFGLLPLVLAIRKFRHQRKFGPYLATTATLNPAPTSWLVRGNVVQGDHQEAPVTAERCVGYHLKLYAFDSKGSELVRERVGLKPFELTDQGTTIAVDAMKGTLLRLMAAELPQQVDEARISEWLDTDKSRAWLGQARRWEYCLELLRHGDAVQVVGHCQTSASGGLKLTRGPRPDDRLCISNEDGSLA